MPEQPKNPTTFNQSSLKVKILNSVLNWIIQQEYRGYFPTHHALKREVYSFSFDDKPKPGLFEESNTISDIVRKQFGNDYELYLRKVTDISMRRFSAEVQTLSLKD